MADNQKPTDAVAIPAPVQIASKVIDEARETITKRRPGVHGDAENSFEMIAELWSTYLSHAATVRHGTNVRVVVEAHDVPEMMSLLKKARKVYGSTNPDNSVDDVGYTALAEGIVQQRALRAKPQSAPLSI